MSRPRGTPTSFGLHGGGRGVGHEGELRGRGGQDKLPNRLQGRRRGREESARGWPCMRPPHPPDMHTQHQEDQKEARAPRQNQRAQAGGVGGIGAFATKENK